MQISDQALREGLLYDMLGRIRHEDVRERSIRSLCQRYHLDLEHASQVETTAHRLFNQAAEKWKLTGYEQSAILGWAARIHELGLTVSHSQYHKHGAYLIESSDLSGFSHPEQALLAALVRGHRRKFPSEVFEALPASNRESAKRLCVLLRLAILLHRGRSTTTCPEVTLSINNSNLKLAFPSGWLEEHPLTHLELKQEESQLQAAGFRLSFG